MLNDIISQLQVHMITGAYAHCDMNWRDIGYLPDYNKFYLIESGEGWLKIGDTEYYPKAGQLFLMPAGVLQSYSSINENTFKKYYCHFTLKSGGMDFFNIVDVPYVIEPYDFSDLWRLFARLIQEHNDPSVYSRLKEKSILLEIVARYLEGANVSQNSIKKTSRFESFNKVLLYVHDHLEEDLVIGRLAETLHYNTAYFTRLFKNYTGMTPSQYIQRTRLEKAKILLETTRMQISEIAEQTGFCDIYYFSNSFKKYTGFSPSDYRAGLRRKADIIT